MSVRGMLGCVVTFGLWWVGRSAYDFEKDFDAVMLESLRGTLQAYPAVPKSTEKVARYLSKVVPPAAPSDNVLIYEGRLIVDKRFLKLEKNRKHANFMASVLKHEVLRNVAYVFSGNSTGECTGDSTSAPGPTPCFVIAKSQAGWHTRRRGTWPLSLQRGWVAIERRRRHASTLGDPST